MPDLSSRGRYEKELAVALLLSWDGAIKVALRGREPNWDSLQGEIQRRATEPLQRATLAAAAGLALELIGSRRLPKDFNVATGQPEAMARGLVSTRRGEWKSSPDPETWINRWMSSQAAESIAVTEVTTAIGHGEALVRSEFEQLGVKLEAIWNIDPRSNVCKICRELNGQPESVWEKRFPGGAPAHVNCRCFLTYRPAP
jgi:hypothetical protein